MFISAKYLTDTYGVNDKIARFLIDRDPPQNNLYWKGKLLYLRPSPGYLFIPLIIDLLFRLGIDQEQLLSEKFIGVMEMTGHLSALEETGQITKQEAIKNCIELVKDDCSKSDWLTNLTDFFNNNGSNFFKSLVTPFKALHRGDVFLFSISVLQFDKALSEKIAQQWFALISTLLLMDDAEDIETDMETGDENAFIESGLNRESLARIAELVDNNIQTISALSTTMATALDEKYKNLIEQTDILQDLNR